MKEFDQLAIVVGKIERLLADRQPGFMSWNMAMADLLVENQKILCLLGVTPEAAEQHEAKKEALRA